MWSRYDILFLLEYREVDDVPKKYLRGYRVLIVLLTIAFVFCSLSPSINRYDRNVPEGAYVYDNGYAEPHAEPYLVYFSWPLALAELVLSLASRRRGAWIAAFFLNLAKTVLPLPLRILLDRLSAGGGGEGRYYFTFSAFGYIILLIGFFLALTYLCAVFEKRKE